MRAQATRADEKRTAQASNDRGEGEARINAVIAKRE
jgi:hypothetical protein